MRTRLTVLVLPLLLASSDVTLRAGQPPPPPPVPAQDDAAAHDALRQLRAVYEQAIRDGRPGLLGPHLATDFHGVMVTGRVVTSLDDLRTYWNDIRTLIGEGGTYTTTLNPELSVILGDTALARGTTDDVVVTGDGTEYRFASFWTATLRREGGAWKIHQLQGSMDPVDNAFVRAFSRRAIVFGAVAAGVTGFALGAVFGLVMTRRKKRVPAPA